MKKIKFLIDEIDRLRTINNKLRIENDRLHRQIESDLNLSILKTEREGFETREVHP
jgi:hypothetical protein